MSIVIIGGNERMVSQYESICKSFGCSAKVFAKKHGALKKNLGVPDLMVLFTATASHKMVGCALGEAKRVGIPVARVHSSSASALSRTLQEHFGQRKDVDACWSGC